ncbi:hypothetical protein DFR74_104428 [Nocardia puris]|uniref:Uncharacterized protein n=1 Tax=Nocardia puris TaxID=208602 RepID=A0A366DNQ0_9NOCA|nr:hypothetical protein DFR74_104428 [Nocardia puris]
MADTRRRVEPGLAIAVPVARFRRDHLDGHHDIVRLITREVGTAVTLGEHHHDVRFGPLVRGERHGHLASDAKILRCVPPQFRVEKSDRQHVELRLRAHENEAPLDQLGVRGKVGQAIQILGHETSRRRT